MQIKSFLISCILVFLLGCQVKPREDNELYIGTISGPETELMEVAKIIAKKKHNLNIRIFEFEDYSMPNTALAEGSIDANMFQHQPYLDIVNKQRNYELISIGKMFVYPMAVYSKKHNSLEKLPEKAIVGIPNDPSNESRALLLLETAGLIKLSTRDPFSLTPDKITENPKNLQFKELIAAQLPRVLEDVDVACINTNFALAAGLSQDERLFQENKDSPYVNIIVIREKDQDHPKFKQLMDALHSDEVLAKAKALFGDQAIAGWK